MNLYSQNSKVTEVLRNLKKAWQILRKNLSFEIINNNIFK